MSAAENPDPAVGQGPSSSSAGTDCSTAVNRSPPASLHRSHPARRLLLAWMYALLTLVFIILTAVYASQTTFASRLRFLYTSTSNTIFVLSLLSGITGIFLAGTISATFELLQWLLVARDNGLSFPSFLGLQAGTGITGLIVLSVWRGHSLWTSARIWGVTRLVSIVLVPILGILIMSWCCPQFDFCSSNLGRQCEHKTYIRRPQRYAFYTRLGYEQLQCLTSKERLRHCRPIDTSTASHVPI
jgi:hypothetical protein